MVDAKREQLKSLVSDLPDDGLDEMIAAMRYAIEFYDYEPVAVVLPPVITTRGRIVGHVVRPGLILVD